MLEEFQELVERHRDRVYTLAAYLLRDREEAADVTQEALLALWRHLGELDGNHGAWLARVTRNACFDRLRKRRSARAALGEPVGDAALAGAACAGPAPDRLAASSDLGRHLRRAVDELAEPYRSVVILREVQEMKYHEISEALGVPLNTVKVHIHRARRQLQDRMKEVMGHAAT